MDRIIIAGNPDRLPTGILALDLAMEGGLPLGSLVEIDGKAHTGKTTLALQILGQAQRAGQMAVCICGTRLPSEAYLAACGVEAGSLVVPPVSETGTLEQALAWACSHLAKGAVVVLDPLPAFPTQVEWQNEEFDPGRKHQRPAILDAFYAIASTHLRRNPRGMFVVVNQLRYVPGLFFGDPWEPTCLEVTEHFQVHLHLVRVQALKEGGQIIGNRVKVKVKKNSGSAPFQEAEFTLLNHAGPDVYGSLFEVALDSGVVVKTGEGYFLGDEALGRPQAVARQRFAELYRNGYGETIRAALPRPALLAEASA